MILLGGTSECMRGRRRGTGRILVVDGALSKRRTEVLAAKLERRGDRAENFVRRRTQILLTRTATLTPDLALRVYPSSNKLADPAEDLSQP